jgi:hypothetical protein
VLLTRRRGQRTGKGGCGIEKNAKPDMMYSENTVSGSRIVTINR